MPIVPISLGLRSNPARHGHAGAARLINCYAEEAGEEAKANWNLFASDGYEDFATLTDGASVRAMLALTDTDLYAVSGRLLYRADATGTVTTLGGIASDGLVTMARNRSDPPAISIVCDGLVYFVTGGVLSQNTDPDLPPPVSVCALDGYFSYLTVDGRHFASDLDSTAINPLSYAASESNPDGGVRNWTRGRDLVIGGAKSLEFWQNAGGDPYPFERVTTRDIGVLAAGSVADLDQTSAFVAHDGTVRVLEGYDARRISTHALERLISSDPNPSGLTACSWQARGHTFYALSGTNFTWVYDALTGKWHERSSYGLDRWRVGQSCRMGTRIILGDYETGNLYEMLPDVETEAGQHLVMKVHTPPVDGFPYRIAQKALYVDVVSGVGGAESYSSNGFASGLMLALTRPVTTTDTSNSQPVMMMRYSDDGGRNWSTERTAPLGAEGDTLRRVKFTRLGMSRTRTYEFSISAAVARCIISASLDMDKVGA